MQCLISHRKLRLSSMLKVGRKIRFNEFHRTGVDEPFSLEPVKEEPALIQRGLAFTDEASESDAIMKTRISLAKHPES